MDSLLSPPIRSNEGDQPTKVTQTFFALDADTAQPVCFLTTTHRDEVDALTRDYPKRWHVEEFFNTPQALGWKRAGTLNLNIRYGQMTMALLAQAAIHPLRQRLGEPVSDWDTAHLADGDIRVTEDTLVVTYYNAPNVQRLREHYQDLPLKLVLVTVLIAVAAVVTFKAVPRARAHVTTHHSDPPEAYTCAQCGDIVGGLRRWLQVALVLALAIIYAAVVLRGA